MSTIIIGLTIILSIVLICGVLIAISNQQSKKRKIKLLQQFSEAGTKHGLSFSRQEILRNRIIGLDGIHRKIVVVADKDASFEHLIIDLAEINSCTARKLYQVSGRANDKDSKPEEHLHSIILQFDFKNGDKKQVYIPFYQNHFNSIYEMNDLHRKAKDWETFVQKMIVKPHNKLIHQ